MVQWLVRYLKMLARYLLCLFYFNNMKQFQELKATLESAKEQLQTESEFAAAKNLTIKRHVEPWLKNASEVLEAVSTLEKNLLGNKTRLTSRLNWSQRCCLSDEIEALKHKIFYVIRDSHFDEAVFNADTLWDKELFSSRPSESLKSAFIKVVQAMKEEGDASRVIAVHGQRGVGKSTLVEVVEKQAKEFLNFEVEHLVVSKSTNAENILKKLGAFLKKIEAKQTEDWQLDLKSKQRVLIILEDFHEELKLESVRIPDHVSCKFLLTASNLQPFSSIRHIKEIKEIKLDGFTEEEARELLQKQASPESDTIKRVAWQIGEKCKSSPVAVKIIGTALRGKPLDEWRKAYNSLTQTLEAGKSKSDRIVYRSVKFSYDRLKDDETRKCFLLCSLFPKDYPIALEDLKRYAWGLQIYEGIDSIEDIGKKVDEAIKNLNESFLLLQQGNTHVRMTNVIREAALWISSKNESILKIKSLVGSWERPNNNGTAISYVSNKLEELDDSEFRSEKLQILFLGGNSCKKISDKFLQWLKGLEVLAIQHGHLSLDALPNLKNLRALHLEHCKLNGLSSVGKLEKLEILSFQGSDISELPNEIEKLDNLRLLDLFGCKELRRIPLTLIRELSRLEELYFSGHSFEKWWSEENRAEGSNITKIILPSSLTIQKTNDERSAGTPTEIILPTSVTTDTSKNQKTIDKRSGATSRALKVSAFLPDQSKWKPMVEFLDRDHLLCYRNHVVPNLVQSVRRVRVKACNLKKVFKAGRILHTREEESGALLSELLSLELEEFSEVSCLMDLWCGQINPVSLENLNTLTLKECPKLQSLFSTALAQSLKQLKTLEIHSCKKLKQVIDDVDETVETPYFPILKTLNINNCGALEYIFKITTGKCKILPELTQLEISRCPQLKHIFSFNVAEGEKQIELELTLLEKIVLKELLNLKTFCSGNHSIKLSSLQHLEVQACDQLTDASMIEAIRHRQLKTFCLFQVGNKLCEDVFKFQGGRLSCLQKITLKEINELPAIWKEPRQLVSLHSLTHLEVVKCNKLKHIFPLLLARNLVQLRHLVVKECKDLCQIAVRERDILPSSSMSRLKPVYFPNLIEILIEDCNKMRSLFPASAACLPKLEALTIRKAPKLAQLFRDESMGEARVKSKEETSEGGSAEAKRKKEIVKLRFPNLKELHLENLANLETLNPVDSCCEFSVLNSLVVKECNKLVTIFEKSESEPTVYAKQEETSSPKRVNYYKLGRYNVTFQEIPKRNGVIDWSAGMEIID